MKKKEIIVIMFLAFCCSINNSFGQTKNREISGTVSDASSGEILIGVSVLEVGTGNGTITNLKGYYKLSVSPNAILKFSYLGYGTIEKKVGAQSTMDITLEESRLELDEVVVVGYGTVKKRDLTGSVASVSAAKIQESPSLTAAQALQGKVPGVMVTNSNWTPGADPTVLIRGTRSINASNDPLYVVDGIPISIAPNMISPGDIESMEVLKDASATAIYGSRGANGVIIITTKKGKKGKIQLDYNGYYGFLTIQNKLELMNGAEYADYVRQSYRAAGKYSSNVPNMALDKTLPSFTSDDYTWQSIAMAYDEDGNYDRTKVRSSAEWWKYVEQTGMVTDHQLNVRGGGDNAQYSFSANYYKTDGIYKQQDYQRYSFRLNIDAQATNWLKLGGQSSFTQSLQHRGTSFQNKWTVNPLGRLYDDDGNLTQSTSGTDTQWWNPLQYLVDKAVVNPLTVNRFLGSYYAEVKLPLNGLRYRMNFGIDFHSKQDNSFYSSLANGGNVNQASKASAQTFGYTVENLLFYDKQIKNHSFGATLLQSVQRQTAESMNITGQDLPSDGLLYNDIGAANTITAYGSDRQQWSLASFMGRLNYNYKNRYYLTASLRYDGSSRLAEGHKWVSFPAFALAWRLNEESFLKNVRNLDNLKLRFGYGVTANTSISPYQTKGVLSQMYYNYGSTEVIGYAPSSFPDKSLTWEKTGQWNIGVDFSFFKSRLNGTIDAYMQNTDKLLLNRQLPVVSGYSAVLTNIGKTKNKGLEISLSTVNIQTKDFNWLTDFTYSTNKEEIVELYNGKEDDITNGWFIGQPVNTYYDYKKIGVWQNTEKDLEEIAKFNANGHTFAPGMIKIQDLNGDYKITSDKDRKILGHNNPSHIFSMSNILNYKDFDFTAVVYATVGGMLENGIRYNQQSYRNNNVKYNYWTPENPTNDFPTPNMLYDNMTYESALYYEKSDFLRIKTITLGYTLPKNLLFKGAISKCRFYATVENPFIFTKYTGVDPEGATTEVGSGYNRSYASPSTTSWLMGLSLSF